MIPKLYSIGHYANTVSKQQEGTMNRANLWCNSITLLTKPDVPVLYPLWKVQNSTKKILNPESDLESGSPGSCLQLTKLTDVSLSPLVSLVENVDLSNFFF